MALTGDQYRQLREALSDGFRERRRLRRMLKEQLDRELNLMVGDGGLEEIVFELVDRADAENWAEDLARAALRENPGNPRLIEFHFRNSLALSAPPRKVLESLLRPANPLYDLELWVRSLTELGSRVCRVEIPKVGVWGTGFLIGPDLVLTNYHVLDPLLTTKDGSIPQAATADVTLRFDFRRLPDGRTSAGSAYRLAGHEQHEWLAVASPPSYHERDGGAGAELPGEDELDVAVVRVSGKPGAPPRGWVDVRAGPGVLAPGDPLVILQHPDGEPIRLAIETDAVIMVNANTTRVTYRANTLPGSSGSPCFDTRWQLAAVHHRGDDRVPPEANEGVPVAAVRTLLERAGLPPA